jgi:hypothetical protein
MRSLALIAVVGVCLASVACQGTRGAATAAPPFEPTARIASEVAPDPIVQKPAPSAIANDFDVGERMGRVPFDPRHPQPRPAPDPIE